MSIDRNRAIPGQTMTNQLPFPYSEPRPRGGFDLGELLYLRRREKGVALLDQEEGMWAVMNSDFNYYCRDFVERQRPTPAERIFGAARVKRDILRFCQVFDACLLDIGASTSVIEELVHERRIFTSGAAIAIAYGRDDLERINRSLKVQQLNASILSKVGWQKVDDFLAAQGKSGFEVILSHMVGGLGGTPIGYENVKYKPKPNLEVGYWLLDQIYQRMGREGSVSYLQVTKKQSASADTYLGDCKGILKIIRGSFLHDALRLERKPGYPDHLPFP